MISGFCSTEGERTCPSIADGLTYQREGLAIPAQVETYLGPREKV